MNELREDFVERIKKGYEKRRVDDLKVYKGDEPFDITEETIDEELNSYSHLLKSKIMDEGR